MERRRKIDHSQTKSQANLEYLTKFSMLVYEQASRKGSLYAKIPVQENPILKRNLSQASGYFQMKKHSLSLATLNSSKIYLKNYKKKENNAFVGKKPMLIKGFHPLKEKKMQPISSINRRYNSQLQETSCPMFPRSCCAVFKQQKINPNFFSKLKTQNEEITKQRIYNKSQFSISLADQKQKQSNPSIAICLNSHSRPITCGKSTQNTMLSKTSHTSHIFQQNFNVNFPTINQEFKAWDVNSISSQEFQLDV